MRGVSCPTTEFCAAMSRQGYIYASTNPGARSARLVGDRPPGREKTAPPRLWHLLPLDLALRRGRLGRQDRHLDESGRADGLERHRTRAAARTDRHLLPDRIALRRGQQRRQRSSAPPNPGRRGADLGRGRARSAASESSTASPAPRPSLCVTGNAADLFVATNPTGPASAWLPTPDVTPLQTTAFSCPTDDACAAANNNADIITSTDPTGGAGAWSFTNAIPIPPNGMFGISCPTTGFCLAGRGPRPDHHLDRTVQRQPAGEPEDPQGPPPPHGPDHPPPDRTC